MKNAGMRRALTAAVVFAAASSASAVTSFGSLGNFDVFNDTGFETEGFEIELHGITSADVQYWFGAPYNRYGDPIKEDFIYHDPILGDVPSVYVRYMAKWNGSVYDAHTAAAVPPIIDTGGHACYAGGPVGNYDTSGCEHFGLSLAKAQTSTSYRWMDGDATGKITAIGTNIALPAPILAVVQPVPAQPPVVRAVIEAPPAEDSGFEFGEAVWLKRIKTQTEQQDHPVELNELLSDNKAFFPKAESEQEIEWFLMQTKLNADPGVGEKAEDNPVGDGKESVALRYEFYKFNGTYDPASHEALCTDGQSNCEDLTPDTRAPFVGDYIGAQMVAANLAPIPEPESYLMMLAGLLVVGGIARRRAA